MNKFFALFLLACMYTSAAAEGDIYHFTVVANNDAKGRCRNSASKIGDEVQAMFDTLVPGFTPYVDEGARFLRDSARDLQVRVCSKTYCSKSVNWQWCLWNGCSCTCGKRRELQANNSNDMAQIHSAKKEIENMLAKRSVELGCELGLEMDKVVA